MAHIPWRRQLRLRAFGSPDLSSMNRKYRRIPSDQTNAPRMRAPRLRSLPGKANCPESAGRGYGSFQRTRQRWRVAAGIDQAVGLIVLAKAIDRAINGKPFGYPV